jgi:hypothetical protein
MWASKLTSILYSQYHWECFLFIQKGKLFIDYITSISLHILFYFFTLHIMTASILDQST